MSITIKQDAVTSSRVMDLVIRERAVALSTREWKHRLAGYGYAIRDTDAGQVIETLPHHVEICALPAGFAA